MTVSITFHGHSTFTINSDGHRLLIDPFFDENPLAKISAEDVEADFILISHGHFDHVADAVSIAKRTGALVISNFEIASWFGKQGVENTHPLHIGGSNQFPFGRCKLTIAHHGSVLPDGSYGGNPAGFLFKFNNGKTVYFSGDTALTYDMKWLADDHVDVALLCVGDNFTMGPADAVKAVKLIEPKQVIPYHFDTWPYIECDIDVFTQGCAQETSAQVVMLGVENTHTVP
ncbi:MAG: metal-dependent hydrolase [Caldilineales bacterium]|nr:metal-dependent hydrolase [Caldilineales bacterium]